MHANHFSLRRNLVHLGTIALAALLVACGSGSGIEPDRQTDGIGASTDTGAGGPSINGGAGGPSINGGAGSSSIGGGAGSSSIGGGSTGAAAGGISCVSDTDEELGTEACACFLGGSSVPANSTAVAACPHNDCCLHFPVPDSSGITCDCVSAAQVDATFGMAMTCSQYASALHHADVVSSCP